MKPSKKKKLLRARKRKDELKFKHNEDPVVNSNGVLPNSNNNKTGEKRGHQKKSFKGKKQYEENSHASPSTSDGHIGTEKDTLNKKRKFFQGNSSSDVEDSQCTPCNTDDKVTSKKKKIKYSETDSASLVHYVCTAEQTETCEDEGNESFRQDFSSEDSCSSEERGSFPSFIGKMDIDYLCDKRDTEDSEHLFESKDLMDAEDECFVSSDDDGEGSISELERTLQQRKSDLESFAASTHSSRIGVVNSLGASQNWSENSFSIRCYSVPHLCTEIVLLRHPCSIVLQKYITVTVLSGKISILGWTMDPESFPVKVFSSKKTGLLQLKTVHAGSIWDEKRSDKHLKDQLTIISSKHVAEQVLRYSDSDTVIVVLRRAHLKAALEFTKLYYSALFSFTKDKRNDQEFYKSGSNLNAISFSPENDYVVEKVQRLIRIATLKETPKPRIIVCGLSQSGKSSFLRYLINKVIRDTEGVCYFDTDPGQTEFTPPGVVSLTNVTMPLLGPPFCHLKKPEKMVYVGSTSIEKCYSLYQECIIRLMDFYKKNYEHLPLFVNTIGWLRNLGLEVIKLIMEVVEPTAVIEIVCEDTAPTFDATKLSDIVGKKVKFYKMDARVSSRENSSFKGKEKRDLSIVSYLGQCQNKFLIPSYLTKFRTICVPYDHVPISVVNIMVSMPYDIMEALLGGFVALCRVDESAILENEMPNYPRTVTSDTMNECIGFAVVRNIDIETRHLHLVTPVPLEEFKKINCIMKGDIPLPRVILLKQPSVGMELCFLAVRKSSASPGFQKVPKRLSFRQH